MCEFEGYQIEGWTAYESLCSTEQNTDNLEIEHWLKGTNVSSLNKIIPQFKEAIRNFNVTCKRQRQDVTLKIISSSREIDLTNENQRGNPAARRKIITPTGCYTQDA